jgi:hypothetical protein
MVEQNNGKSSQVDHIQSRHKASGPTMLIISILALIGAPRFRERAPAAGIGRATKKGAAV